MTTPPIDHKRMIGELMHHHRWRQSDLAAEVKVTQGTVSKWLRGQTPDGKAWLALKSLHDKSFDKTTGAKEMTRVKVMGFVGAGAEVMPEYEQLPSEGLAEIDVPMNFPEDAIAFQVIGGSMFPRFRDGDVVICWTQTENVEDALGWEAVVRTEDGRRFLKDVLRGSSPGRFNLVSHAAEPISDQVLVWAARVGATIAKHEWRKVIKINGSSNERHRAA